MMKHFLSFFFALISTTVVFSQSGKAIYNDSILHEIRVQIDLPDWFEKLEENYKNNLEDPENYPEVYLLCHAVIDGKVIDSIGIREKGNYSNGINSIEKKKPFKLAFDEFKEQKFNGIKKINLNNGTDDPSFLRESLVFKLMRDEGKDKDAHYHDDEQKARSASGMQEGETLHPIDHQRLPCLEGKDRFVFRTMILKNLSNLFKKRDGP